MSGSLCVAWQGSKIFPYTPLAPVQVKRACAPAGAASFRLLIANVLMQNRQFDCFLQVVQATDPDLILAAEPGQEEEAQEKLDLATTDPGVRAGEATPQKRDTC